MQLDITIRRDLTEKEISVKLYHEILEAAAVGSAKPPPSVLDLNEGDFERAAYKMFDSLGPASLENLNRMLKLFGFEEH